MTMKPLSAIFHDIQLMVGAGTTSGNPRAGECAEEYARLCRHANERLHQCVSFLEKSRRREAIQEAEAAEPHLLNLCAQLDFPEAGLWRELCATQQLPVPESLDALAIEALNEAYAAEGSLEPFLRVYRRAALLGYTRQAVQVLRQIQAADAGNPVWRDALRDFEQQRQKELANEFRRASEMESLDTLERLQQEFCDKWLTPPDRELAARLAGRIAELQAKAATRIGDELVDKLNVLYAEKTATALNVADGLLQELNTLLSTKPYEPTLERRQQIDEIREWVTKQRQAEREDNEFQRLVHELREELAKGRPRGHTKRLWRQLVRFDRALDPELKARAERAVTAYELSRRRRLLLQTVLAGLAVLICVGAVALVFLRQREHRILRRYAERLADAHAKQDVNEMNRLLQEFRQLYPRLMPEPGMQGWPAKVAQLEKDFTQQDEEFLQAWKRLDGIRGSGFQEASAEIAELLTGARRRAHTPEKRALLTQFEAEWDAKKVADQTAIDQRIRPLLERLASDIPQTGRFGTMGLTAVKEKVLALEKLGQDAAAISGVSPELAVQLKTLRTEVDTLKQKVVQREEPLRLMAGALRLEDYLRYVHEYVKAFPDDALTEALKNVDESADLYTALVALPAVREFDPDTLHSAQVLEANVDDNRFWGSTVKELREHNERVKNEWPDVAAKILKWENSKMLTALRSFTLTVVDAVGNGKRQAGFVLGEFEVKVSKINGQPQKPIVTGKVYLPKVNDPARFDEEKGFTPGVRVNDLQDEKIMAHCFAMQELFVRVHAVRTPETADLLLVDTIEQVAGNSEITPLLRIRILEQLIGYLLQLSGDEGMLGWKKAMGDFGEIDGALHWLCVENPAVKEANAKANTLLIRHFSVATLPQAYRQRWFLPRASLTRNLKFAGFVSLDEPLRLVWCKRLPRARCREVWVVRADEDRKAHVTVLADINPDVGQFPALTGLRPGEPVFAPTDDRTASDLLTWLLTQSGTQTVWTHAWPSGWPENRRQ